MNILESIPRLIRRMVGWMVVLVLGWMILLALSQLLLRWFFSSAIPWADPQLRQMVLWIGLLGGVLAAADGRHIRIDIAPHYLHGKAKFLIERMGLLIAALGSFYLALLSIRFLRSEQASGTIIKNVLFGFDLAQWVFETVIPFGYALMGFYFLISILTRDSKEQGIA